MNHCTKPPTANLREPMMMPPCMACCRGNSAARTSSSCVSGYGCPFPFLGEGIDHYSTHQVLNQCGTGAEQWGIGWTDADYLFLTEQITWRGKPDKKHWFLQGEICSIHAEMGQLELRDTADPSVWDCYHYKVINSCSIFSQDVALHFQIYIPSSCFFSLLAALRQSCGKANLP